MGGLLACGFVDDDVGYYNSRAAPGCRTRSTARPRRQVARTQRPDTKPRPEPKPIDKPALIPPETQPYSLPLSREAFATALRIGHGRAYEHAAAHGIDDRLDDVLYAMLHDHAWDPQLDHNRDEWVLDIVRAANAESVLVPRFLEQVNHHPPSERRWADRAHRNGIIATLARSGHFGMRELLYDRLVVEDGMDYVSGAEIVVWLDGPEGLIRSISTIAQWRARDPETPLFSWYLWSYDDTRESSCDESGFPAPDDKRDARTVLEDARGAYPGIDRWLTDLAEAGMDPWDQDDADDPTKDMSFEEWYEWRHRNDPKTADEVIKHIEKIPADASFDVMNDTLSWSRVWAHSATTEQFETVRRALSAATEQSAAATTLRGYLRIFVQHAMPTVTPPIIGLLNHSDKLVRYRAIQALRHVRDPRIRAHAIEKLRQPSPDFDLIQLLKANHEPGDAGFLESLLVVTADAAVMDDLCYALREVYEKNVSDPEAAGLMRFIYEHAPSATSRRRAYDVLEALGKLPDWIKSEVAHDAYDHLSRKARPGGGDEAADA